MQTARTAKSDMLPPYETVKKETVSYGGSISLLFFPGFTARKGKSGRGRLELPENRSLGRLDRRPLPFQKDFAVILSWRFRSAAIQNGKRRINPRMKRKSKMFCTISR